MMNERLKEVRKAKGINLTQREFGRRLGVKDTAISKLENGENTITDQMILAVCREFGVDEDWLRTGNGKMLVENDNAIISELVSELNLDDMAKNILMAYKGLNKGQREGVIAFVQALSQAVLEENIVRTHNYLHDEIETFNGDDEELHDRLHATFASEFPFIEFNNEDVPQPSIADKAIERVKTYQAAESRTGKEHGIVTESQSEIDRLKKLPRVTDADDL